MKSNWYILETKSPCGFRQRTLLELLPEFLWAFEVSVGNTEREVKLGIRNMSA